MLIYPTPSPSTDLPERLIHRRLVPSFLSLWHSTPTDSLSVPFPFSGSQPYTDHSFPPFHLVSRVPVSPSSVSPPSSGECFPERSTTFLRSKVRSLYLSIIRQNSYSVVSRTRPPPLVNIPVLTSTLYWNLDRVKGVRSPLSSPHWESLTERDERSLETEGVGIGRDSFLSLLNTPGPLPWLKEWRVVPRYLTFLRNEINKK